MKKKIFSHRTFSGWFSSPFPPNAHVPERHVLGDSNAERRNAIQNAYPPPRPNYHYMREHRQGKMMMRTADLRGKVLSKVFLNGRWTYVA